MAIQVQGGTSGVSADVLANTRALLATLRANDIGSLGAFQMSQASGIMAAGLGSAAPIAAFRYGAANLAIIRRVTLTMGGLGTGFTAGQVIFNLFAARSFTASDSGGNAATLTGNNGKLRTGHATTGVSDFRVSSTATLTAGTRTLDATPVKSLSFGVGTTASVIYLTAADLINGRNSSEWPLVLAQNEGFVVQATVPATGTWCFSLDVLWEEVAAF